MMFSKYKNNEIVKVNGIGKCNNTIYINKKGFIICRDPYYKDYNIQFDDGSEDWIEESFINKI